MGNIDKRIETVEKYITGMDNIGCLEMDKTVTIGVGMGDMYGADGVTVKVKTDIFGEGHHW